MNEHYLWDKSGAPDEEIQELESLLSEFRYQPRPLALPEEQPTKRIFYFAPIRLAALAAMIILTIGAGFWLSQRNSSVKNEIADNHPESTPTPTAILPAPENREALATNNNGAPSEDNASRSGKKIATPAPKIYRAAHKRAKNRNLEAEGEIAKEKVLFALQLTRSKLDLINKKLQADIN